MEYLALLLDSSNSGSYVGLFVSIGVVVLVLFIFLIIYNTLVRLRNLVKESWSDVDTELKRRHDLVPNLVESVKGYMKYEKGVLEKVTQLRSQILSSNLSPKERGVQESELSRGIKSIFALSENYPDLKSDAHFKELMSELIRTEDRIQSARRYFNGNVRDLNIRIESVPSNIIASMFRFNRESYFEIEESSQRDKPDVVI